MKIKAMTFSVGCEKFGTAIMKEHECLLFAETALENGSDVSEMLSDMRMIDTLMHMKRLYTITHGTLKLTQAGYARKNSTLGDSLMSIVDGRVQGRI